MISYANDVKIISSFHKCTRAYGKVESRASHGFIFKIKGFNEYLINGKTFILKEGEAAFLPKGLRYEYKTDGKDDSLYTSINFDASFEEAEFGIYPVENFHATNYITQSFSELFKFGTNSDKYKCLSILYDLLSYVSRFDRQKNAEKDKQNAIEPAVEYLKTNVYSNNLRIDKLHILCGISDTYFRKIFKSRYDMGPQEYVLSERLNHAKSILESCDFDTIREVALSVGYTDPLYFSKAFKKFYGISPSDINKNSD